MSAYTMKDSGVEWVLKIPIEWKLKKLQHLLDVKDGTHDTPSYESSKEGNYPFVTSKDITNNKIDFNSTKFINKDYYDQYKTRSNVSVGDIVMPMIGTIGNSAIVDTEKQFAIKNLALFKTSESEKVDTNYFYYFLESKSNKEQFYLLSKGGVQSFLSLTTLRNLKLINPLPVEQKAIANYLDNACEKIDKTISLKQQQLNKLDEYRKSIIHEAVTKGLDKNVPMKDSGVEWLGDIPEHWTTDRVKDLCVSIESGGTPKSNINEYWDGNITWVSPTDFTNQKNNKYIFDSLRKITPLGLKKSSAKLLPKNTVLMTSRASIGEVKITGNELCTNQGFIACIASAKLDFNFLYYCIKCHLGEYFLNIASGTTFMEISRKEIKIALLPVPTYKEQQKIANYLDIACDKIDKTKVVIETQIEKLTQYRQSLIHECVTGKKRVYQGDIN